MKLLYVLAAAVLCCTGCSHVMSDAGIKQVDSSITYPALAANPEHFVGKMVMVGGILSNATGSGDVTTFEIAQLGLFTNGVPDEFTAGTGWFLAVSTQLVDPAMYRQGSLVTIIGEVKGKKIQNRDGADYSYPYIAVKEMRFFRPSSEMPDLHANPYLSVVGDDRFILSPPGLPEGEPRKQQ